MARWAVESATPNSVATWTTDGTLDPGGYSPSRILRKISSAERARALAEDEKVTKAELIRAPFFLGQSCRAVVDVAECRGERLQAPG